QVRPFVLTDGAQFRPTPPPALTSPAYARALNEVRDKGRDTAPARTADETAAAQFWGAPIWNYWNEIAQRAATRHGTGLATTARAPAATVLRGFFGNWDRLTVTSEAVPGATRTFPGYRAAATEAGLSRIAAGVHTRTDHDAGTRLGRRVAAYVLRQWRSTWA